MNRHKNITFLIVTIAILSAFFTWEYRQSNLINELKQIIGKEKIAPKTITAEKVRVVSTSEYSKPMEGVIPLSTTEEQDILKAFREQIEQLKTTEQTSGRLPLLGEKEWLNLSKFVDRVAKVCCPLDNKGKLFSCGSGFLTNKDGNILTNYHVTQGMVGNRCFVAFSSDYRQPPNRVYVAYLTDRYDSVNDYISLYIEKMIYPREETITNRNFPYIPACDSNIVQLGDPIVILGYPSYGGETITITDGIISGSLGNYFKTNAKIDKGNSGGPVMIDDPQYECYIGVATFGIKGELGGLSYMIKSRTISGYNW
jgi:S1-C subfamily serine protease